MTAKIDSESLHYSVIVRDSSETASALVDFRGEDIESASAVNVLLDPSFLVFSDDIDPPDSSARRAEVDSATIRSALPFYASKDELEAFGTQLYNQLFGNEKLLVSMAAARQSGRVSSRPIRLCFENWDASRYSDLPWEALCYPGPPPVYLGDSQDTNIVRTVKDLPEMAVRPLSGAVRVLIVSASPDAANHVMVDEELLAVKKHVEVGMPGLGKKDRKFKFKWLKPVRQSTKADFVNALDTFKPHIVHFIGHGSYENGVGYLHLHGSSDPDEIIRVSAKDLVVMMKDRRPELILLNSCEGAVGGTGNFSGIAESLLKTLCARFIVAMQYPISNAAAIAFVEGFYPALQQGKPVDVAVSCGRNRIHLHEKPNVAVEFITPTLYMNGDDARLFDVPAAAKVSTSERPAWLVPVLLTVVAVALIAAVTLMFVFRGASDGPPEALQPIQIIIAQGNYAEATARIRKVLEECETAGCDPQTLESATRAAELLGLVEQVSTAAEEADWTATDAALSRLESESSASWLQDELRVDPEYRQLVSQQAEAERALTRGEWRSAASQFRAIRTALSLTSGTSTDPVRQSVIPSLSREAQSGQSFADARAEARAAVSANRWQLAAEQLAAAVAARPGQAGTRDESRLASELLQTVMRADRDFEAGNYAQASGLYLSIIRDGISIDAQSDWYPIVSHAEQRVAEIEVLTGSDGGADPGPTGPVPVEAEPIVTEPIQPEPAPGEGGAGAAGGIDVVDTLLIPFATDSAVLGRDAREQIDAIASAFLRFDGLTLRVTGRADARGDAAYNEALSDRRAAAVASALREAGVAPSSLTVLSVGERWAGSEEAGAERLARDRAALLEMVYSDLPAVRFAFDSARVPEGSAARLESLARWLRDHQGVHVVVTGHTDSIGRPGYNDALGLRRADAVAGRLEQLGVSPSRIRAVSAGESRLVYPDAANPAQQQANRRASIALFVVDASSGEGR